MTDQQHMPLPNDPDGLVEWLRTAPSNEWCGPMLNKAADEIVALRSFTVNSPFGRRIRAAALEEAARVCEQIGAQGFPQAGLCVSAIRALASPPEPSDNE